MKKYLLIIFPFLISCKPPINPNEVKAGDIVRLKSGSVIMTIGNIDSSGYATCYWFCSNQISWTTVHLLALEKSTVLESNK